MLFIILRFDLDESFFSHDAIWRGSNILIQLDESDLLDLDHVFEGIYFSRLWLEFVSALNVFVWIWFFFSRREEFCTNFLCVCLKTFSDISDCLSMRSCELSFSESEPFFGTLFDVEMIFWSHSGKVIVEIKNYSGATSASFFIFSWISCFLRVHSAAKSFQSHSCAL